MQLGERHFDSTGGLMQRIAWKCFSLLLVASSVLGLVTTGKAAEQPTVSEVLKGNLDYVEKSVVPAAEAMPADKFSFAPTNGEFKGVRTYAQLIKHIAVWNYRFGASILEEKPPVDTGGPDENGPAALKSKVDVTKYLADSFAYLQKAIATIDQKNLLLPIKAPWGKTVTRLGMAVSGIDHPFDLYGQMVEYLRMNGIVPPASR
jgi:DinB superfamily